MTENKAIKRMRYRVDTATNISGKGVDGKAYEDMEMAIKALSEIQQYRSIGTVEECREARERQIPIKPKGIYKTRYIWDSAYCPVCGCGITARWNFCQSCGQAISWESDTP